MTKDFSLEIRKATLCYVTLETTGVDPRRGGEICEIATIKCVGEKVLDKYETFIKTVTPISDSIIRRRKIEKSKIESAPDIEFVLSEFLKFINGYFLVTYNMHFTTWFINAFLKGIQNERLKNHVFGLREIASKLYGAKIVGSLKTLASEFGIQAEDSKSCMEEALLMKDVFLNMLKILEGKDIKTLFALREFQGEAFTLSIIEEMRIRERIQKFIDESQTIEIQYYSPWTETESRRKVDPYEIKMKKKSLYLIGYCHTKRDIRYFRLKRIRDIKPTFEKFTRPENYELSAFFREDS